MRPLNLAFSLLLGALVYLPKNADAQMAEDPRAWTVGFFEVLMNEGESDAIRMLKEESFLGQHSPGAVAHLGELLGQMKAMSGTTINCEFIREKKLGSRVTKLVYVSNHVYLPIFYAFVFYKANHGWQLVSVEFMNETSNYPFD